MRFEIVLKMSISDFKYKKKSSQDALPNKMSVAEVKFITQNDIFLKKGLILGGRAEYMNSIILDS